MFHLHKEYSFILFFCAIIASGLISFALCLTAELNKFKIQWGALLSPCNLGFRVGMAALICLSITQIIGSFFICRKFHSQKCCKVRKPSFSCVLMVFSWISFGLAVLLMSGATSISGSQPFGEGWLNGECYLVKDGVFVASALLGLLALGSTLSSGAISMNRREAEEDGRIHAQVGD